MRRLRFVHTIYAYSRGMVEQFLSELCFTRAAGLAYTTLLAIVPLMTVSLVLLSAFPEFQWVSKKIQDFVFSNFVAGSADVVQQHIQSFTESARHLSLTGLIFLVITAVMMVFNMESDFNAIWQVKKRRHGVSAFLIYFAVLTLLPLLIGVGIVISADLGSLPFVIKMKEFLRLEPVTNNYLPYFLTWSVFAVIYVTVPNCTVKIRHALVGSFVAMLFFVWAKAGFTWYLAHFPSYALVYGALAAIPIFLIWLYLTWLIILFGAVVTQTIATGNKKEN